MPRISQEDLEHKLMELLLQGDHPMLSVLRQQYEAARVIDREFTGKGFFTDFEVPDSLPKTVPENIAGGCVDIKLRKVRCGAGALLFVRDGKIRTLEVYSFDHSWPKRLVIKSLTKLKPVIGS